MDDVSKNISNLLGGKGYLREKCTQGNGYSKKSENYSYTIKGLNHFCKGDSFNNMIMIKSIKANWWQHISHL